MTSALIPEMEKVFASAILLTEFAVQIVSCLLFKRVGDMFAICKVIYDLDSVTEQATKIRYEFTSFCQLIT